MYIFCQYSKNCVRSIVFKPAITKYSEGLKVLIYVYRIFNEVMVKIQDCVLQIIWSRKCLINYTVFQHRYRVTFQ
jgi:hypothetical protein